MDTKKYKVGYICGCFDLFHVGHLNILEKCKNNCEYLLVGVCDDSYIERYKNRKPVFGQEDRRRIIEALKCVDRAIIVNEQEIFDKTIVYDKVLKFNVLFNGDDWIKSERFKKTEEDLSNRGVDIVFFPYTVGISTSSLREEISK